MNGADMAQIRVGIAGLGRSGWKIHARLLAPLTEQYQIVAVVDDDAARRAEAMDRFGCAAYTEFDQLLSDDQVELIVVALPSHLHADATLAALAAGKHVVCEKPMATTLADADRLVDAAASATTVLSIFQNRRYSPDFVQVRQLIESSLLGRIVQIRLTESRFARRWDWQTLRKFGGGTLNNKCAHLLDQALLLFGPQEPELFCHLDWTLTLGDAEDHVKIVLKADGAPTMDIEASSCAAFPSETWNIMGTQGGLAGSINELRWQWVDPAQLPPRTLDIAPTPDRRYNRDEIPWQHGSWRLEDDRTPGYTGFYLDLFATIRNGAPLVITPASVRRVIRLQEMCHTMAGF